MKLWIAGLHVYICICSDSIFACFPNTTVLTQSTIMSTIVCNVIDLNFMGLKGMHVTLECLENTSEIITEFEAQTDEDGRITQWYPKGDDVPKIVDTRDFNIINMIFFTAEYFEHRKTPLATATGHMDTINHIHSVTVQFGAGDTAYSLSQVKIPIACPPGPATSRTSSPSSSESQIIALRATLGRA
ncbi:hypothetical protein BKA67DRAFT_689703 [Truncatella angustata]|uniref:Transthyretin/hydroxyisourate hydrolase domain-containing protein n=1 Tax=Truncatella angustata TaxID=152316 RepID=A0A9P8UUU5_9PEZI|nr:uncharacterized protein BKA67DRAFT_689703 [Truncatella angustata]KAH6658614.1 hypothetical protein BKA67DRAFT_689703 [Truncatella angustata]